MSMAGVFAGRIRVELTSADLPGALDTLAGAGIPVYDTEQKGELTTHLSLRRIDYPRTMAVCEKRGDTLKIDRKTGLFWTVKGLLKRPLLLLGLMLLFLAVTYLPSRVFFVEVEGNGSIPARKIIAAAEDCGIRFGASRREIRSERVKNALLEALPELQWAGVNTYGCVAKISVRQRSEQPQPDTRGGIGSVVASRDGIVTYCTATRGNLLCRVGKAVKKGEVLISGYTDCGLCIRSELAEGEVYARTRRKMDAVVPGIYEKRQAQTATEQKYSLLLGKKRINLWKDSGICDASCGRMYKEYYMTLPGGFQLPLALVVETQTRWDYSNVSLEQEEAEKQLVSASEDYLRGQMVAGAIHAREQKVTSAEDVYRLAGEYVCIELIGTVQREWIGDTNGKTD